MAQKTMLVLLVEDDDNHAELIRRNLERPTGSSGEPVGKLAGENRVEHVRDGISALAYLRNEPPYEAKPRPDLILLDLKLPKLNGHEVLRQIKSDKNLLKIPVVVMTTSATEFDRDQAYTLHANSYLVKPVDFASFRKMLEDLSIYWGHWNQPVPKVPLEP